MEKEQIKAGVKLADEALISEIKTLNRRIRLNNLKMNTLYFFDKNNKKKINALNTELGRDIDSFEQDRDKLLNHNGKGMSQLASNLALPAIMSAVESSQNRKKLAGRTRNTLRFLGAPIYFANKILKAPVKIFQSLETFCKKRQWNRAAKVAQGFKNLFRLVRLPLYALNSGNKKVKNELKSKKNQYREGQELAEVILDHLMANANGENIPTNENGLSDAEQRMEHARGQRALEASVNQQEKAVKQAKKARRRGDDLRTIQRNKVAATQRKEATKARRDAERSTDAYIEDAAVDRYVLETPVRDHKQDYKATLPKSKPLPPTPEPLEVQENQLREQQGVGQSVETVGTEVTASVTNSDTPPLKREVTADPTVGGRGSQHSTTSRSDDNSSIGPGQATAHDVNAGHEHSQGPTEVRRSEIVDSNSSPGEEQPTTLSGEPQHSDLLDLGSMGSEEISEEQAVAQTVPESLADTDIAYDSNHGPEQQVDLIDLNGGDLDNDASQTSEQERHADLIDLNGGDLDNNASQTSGQKQDADVNILYDELGDSVSQSPEQESLVNPETTGTGLRSSQNFTVDLSNFLKSQATRDTKHAANGGQQSQGGAVRLTERSSARRNRSTRVKT